MKLYLCSAWLTTGHLTPPSTELFIIPTMLSKQGLSVWQEDSHFHLLLLCCTSRIDLLQGIFLTLPFTGTAEACFLICLCLGILTDQVQTYWSIGKHSFWLNTRFFGAPPQIGVMVNHWSSSMRFVHSFLVLNFNSTNKSLIPNSIKTHQMYLMSANLFVRPETLSSWSWTWAHGLCLTVQTGLRLFQKRVITIL